MQPYAAWYFSYFLMQQMQFVFFVLGMLDVAALFY
jgi:hypothetical protein